ncbi:MAG TPA: hypothetical protein VFN10_06410 [Thermoanaerobaculia bacterium]|nr:hypothetical protein [Thermoanaerobaculia bacterium]
MPHFDIPLDLPHAARIAGRIVILLEQHLEETGRDAPEVMDAAESLDSLLFKYSEESDNPPGVESARLRDRAATLGRQLVDALESSGITGDRIGQLVRNLFECLELGEEGAQLSLRAGERVDSLQRPV